MHGGERLRTRRTKTLSFLAGERPRVGYKALNGEIMSVELDVMIRESLTQFAQEVARTNWRGRERE